MKKIIIIAIIISVVKFAIAQDGSSQYPKIGEKISPFELKEINEEANRIILSNDLRGKFVILDFWSKYCGACIASFPKLDSIQRKFSKELQIILVGYLDREQRIKKVYEIHQAKHKLNLTTSYDTLLFEKFKIQGVPHLVWIDSAGEVKAVTRGNEVNESNIVNFLSGKNFDFEDISYDAKARTKFDLSRPFLVEGNGGSERNYLVRSILTKWVDGMPISGVGQISKRTRKIECLKSNLESLYYTAFYTNFKNNLPNWKSPFFKTKDSLVFQGNNQKFYCYSLTSPDGFVSGIRLQSIMQNDLRNYFGFDARVEQRSLPCWSLVTVDKQKIQRIKSSNSQKIGYWDDSGGAVYDIPLSSVAAFIAARLKPSLNVFNETGIDFKIDLVANGDMTNYDIVRKELQKFGLDLLPSMRDQNVLVIFDISPRADLAGK